VQPAAVPDPDRLHEDGHAGRPDLLTNTGPLPRAPDSGADAAVDRSPAQQLSSSSVPSPVPPVPAADLAASYGADAGPEPQESLSLPTPAGGSPYISVTGAATGKLPGPGDVDAATLRAVPLAATVAAAEHPKGAHIAGGNVAAGSVPQSAPPDIINAGAGDVASADSSRASERQGQHASTGQLEAQPASGGIPFRQSVAAVRPAHAWLPAPASSVPFQAAPPPPLPGARASWLPPPQFTSRINPEPQVPQSDPPPQLPLSSAALPAVTHAGHAGASTATGAAASPAAVAADHGEAAEHEVAAPVGPSQPSAPAAHASGQPPPVAGQELPVAAGGSSPLSASPAQAQASGGRTAGHGRSAPDALAKATIPSEAASAGEPPCVDADAGALW